MTDKEKILAKIESLLNEINYEPYTDETFGRIQSLKELKSYIDSLQEEPVSEDFEEEIVKNVYEPYFDLGGVAVKGATYYLTVDDLADIVRHFARWQKQQMMRDAITTVVTENYGVDKIDGEWRRVSQNKITVFPNNVSIGDKVKVIIVKED